ncbi:DNA fragmentation factor subunit alpha isoform X1 [Scleropages formosus]|uniref:DNA fragmentation factor subunit alpha isoform X1 n=1 Tax=Scleropages formosus TaxID=113540 RepID=UPI0008782D03|nr:DNA fragmentation factor subunit alpha isoform X1 [Scleropages formosus]
MAELKPCKVCDYSRRKLHGLVAPSLRELKSNGCTALGLDPHSPVSVVLEDDGTIVEDETYFLCLPPNTKFMLLCEKEMWAPRKGVDGGTAWLSRDSFEVNSDTVDAPFSEAEAWHGAASRLRVDLASVLLMSEAELQGLVDAPCSDLAAALGFRNSQARALQDALQRALDRREEERQSRELLQLYLKAVEKEGGRVPIAGGESAADEADGPPKGTSSTFSPRTLMVLKGKTRPETRLSNEQLQVTSPVPSSPKRWTRIRRRRYPGRCIYETVVNVGAVAMATTLGWDQEKSAALVAACEAELCIRLQRVRALRSLSARSQEAAVVEAADGVEAKRKK